MSELTAGNPEDAIPYVTGLGPATYGYMLGVSLTRKKCADEIHGIVCAGTARLGYINPGWIDYIADRLREHGGAP